MRGLLDIFEGFRFAHPWWLLLFLLLPLLLAWLGKRTGASAIGYSTLSILKDLGKRRGGRDGWFSHLLLIGSLALLIIALARPQTGTSLTKVTSSGVDILLVLDVSSSMLAEDFTIGGQRASRLQAVKSVTEDFIKARPSDRIGMIAFAAKPFLVSPMTLDHDWLLEHLEERVIIYKQIDGTAIGSAITSAANRLENSDSESRIMVLLTDGTNNAGPIQPLTAAEAAEALELKIYTIGAGTRGMAPMPVGTDMFGKKRYRNIQVEFDEETLTQIAEKTGGKYFRATGTNSLKAIYDEIDELETTDVEIEKYELVDERFIYLLVPGAILALLHLILHYTIWRRLP